MRAVILSTSHKLVDVEVPDPEPGAHDLLVRIEAVSVNPVDVKSRGGSHDGEPRILGYDAAGVVEAVGPKVTRFRPGDEVYYAGNVRRQGSNAELQVVDERIVGHKPAGLDMAQAAALPLTTITAWESLFEHLGLTAESTGTLLVVGAAGGVGSMVTQLARSRTELTIIGTASRADSQRWAREMGADEVVDHHQGLARQVLKSHPDGVEYVFSPHSASNVGEYARVLKPFGHVVAIDEVDDIQPLKAKSIAWHWELMFTRPTYAPDDDSQGRLLDEVARMVDAGDIRSTLTTRLGPLDAATLTEAHRLVGTGSGVGKVVVQKEPAGPR
ncbi:zinc-binding alcohol dehydrogenase family protein [Paractinoplanes atraurantiacus]|uniref:Zinc-type alcohol dehydrogenase-like protein n=1 Tax=Paractinoplanes atraurantiacus TaxID=1036182 RepID=A0A285J0Q4_9ACTN|nr:zinc-binding alcohol dehydrogenase family protein [Actinoplanes atraurantiacus]SNY53663.1 zinc-binding alcohol dehydrogenase family protein [Actinoplanes atraurantiacus]